MNVLYQKAKVKWPDLSRISYSNDLVIFKREEANYYYYDNFHRLNVLVYSQVLEVMFNSNLNKCLFSIFSLLN